MVNLLSKIPKLNVAKIKATAPLVFFGLVLFGESLAVSFYFPKKIFSLLDQRQKVADTARDVAELRLAVEALGKVDGNQLTGLFSKAESVLPGEKQVAGVVSGISALASVSGVVTKGIEFTPGRVSTASSELALGEQGVTNIGDGIVAVPVSVSLFASLDQLLDFMERLQKGRQLLGINSANYTSVNVPEGSLGLVVYILPGRTGKLGWKYIPAISTEDLSFLVSLSGQDIFSLPIAPR